MSGPTPSRLMLLSELGTCEKGEKVRFLGCVDEYVVKTATVRLKHNYPPSEKPAIANVDVGIVLESIKHDELDVGAWINVMGYVERGKEKGVFVQAVAIWDAGNVDLTAYQKAVEARKDAA